MIIIFFRGIHEVGQPKFSIETHAPAPARLPPGFSVTRFPDLASCRDYVHSRGGTLVGVEIGEGARNVDEEPFSGTCAFMPGNEVSGAASYCTVLHSSACPCFKLGR